MAVIQNEYNPKKFNLKIGERKLVSVIQPEDIIMKNGRQFISEQELRVLRG